MSKPKIVGGIDIGSYAVKTLIVKHKEDKRPKVIGLGTHSADGLREGEVKDPDDATRSIAASVQEAENMAGVSLGRYYVSLNGKHIGARIHRGFVSVSRADQEISESDIERVTDLNSLNAYQPNRDVIHAIPLNFMIDQKEVVKNPLGLKGFRLEAEVLIVDGLSAHLKNLENCIHSCGIDIIETCYAPLAASYAVLNKQEREYGALILDFGSEVSSVSLFDEGTMHFTSAIPFGSRAITYDINVGLRIPFDQAEIVKLTYGFLDKSNSKSGYKRDQIDLASITGQDDFSVSRKDLENIVSSRVNEWLGLISKEYNRVRKAINPTIAVLIGGGVNMKGVDDLIRDKLSLPTRIGRVNINSVVEEAEDPSYAVAAGMCLWALEKEDDGGSSIGVDLSFIRGIIKWFKNFIP